MVSFVASDEELRTNHEFVLKFETLRKRYGHREMHDLALRDVAVATGVSYEDLRVARHLRNALAHGEAVNRDSLRRADRLLLQALGGQQDSQIAVEVCAPKLKVRAYRLHAWRDAALEQMMIANGFVSIGGEEIGDLTHVNDAAVIAGILSRSMPDRTPRAIAIFVGYWRRFLWEAEPGDLAVLPIGTGKVAIGEFVGGYHYVAEAEPHARHRRTVSWNALVDRDAFSDELLVTIKGRHTVQEFKADDAAARILALSTTASSARSEAE